MQQYNTAVCTRRTNLSCINNVTVTKGSINASHMLVVQKGSGLQQIILSKQKIKKRSLYIIYHINFQIETKKYLYS